MSLILDGTNGLSDVDGTAGTPAIRGSDANTGVFFGTDIVGVSTGGSERMRVDASGRVLVGLSSSVGGTNGAALQVKGATGVSDFSIALMDGDTTVAGRLHLESTGSNSIALQADPDNLGASTYLGFGVDGTERARIDSSGNLYVGKTTDSVTTVGWSITSGGTGTAVFTQAATNEIFIWNNTSTAGTAVVQFRTANTSKGAISWNNTNTTYATTSDYRLKHDIAPMTGALAKVALLKPCTYKWKVDGSGGQGFIAHELAEVEPGCVTGEKDAVDAEGNPQYQGIDTSFLVATLTAAIQEQQAIIESLTARVVALEQA